MMESDNSIQEGQIDETYLLVVNEPFSGKVFFINIY